jgi:hypothetical protein
MFCIVFSFEAGIIVCSPRQSLITIKEPDLAFAGGEILALGEPTSGSIGETGGADARVFLSRDLAMKVTICGGKITFEWLATVFT